MNDQDPKSPPRRHVRVEVALQVKFTCLDDMEAMIKASTIDLSHGGMFIQSASRRKSGQRVAIELPGPDGQGVPVAGVIRHVRYQDGEPVGFGIEFEPLGEPARELISQLLRRTGRDDQPVPYSTV